MKLLCHRLTAALTEAMAALVFGWRRTLLAIFALTTILLGISALQLRVDAGFSKMIPLEHPYMQTFTKHRTTFGGADRMLVAVMARQGDIFTPAFFNTLKDITDEVFFIPGVDRATVTSLFTPNVRFIEVVEEGFSGGNVIPADFAATPADLERVRVNIQKAGGVGRLVANDFTGALVRAEVLEFDPDSGARIDYRAIADRLEAIRDKFENGNVSIHIIGFAKAVGDITDGAHGVLSFFALAFVITAILLYFYSTAWRLTWLALTCALLPVIWLLGLLPLLGFGIDPMSILVPYLIFAIGVSHAVQMTNAWKLETLKGGDALTAARNSFLKLFLPGAMALLANALGFLVIMHIRIDIVRELGITASLGVLLMIITNKMLLPILLSYTRLSASALSRAGLHETAAERLWARLAALASPRPALIVLACAAVLTAFGAWQARQLKTGDLGKGIPELRDDSRYNRDNAVITDKFTIGVDVLAVITETRGYDGACTNHGVMDAVDRFGWCLRNIDGVQSVLSLPVLAKQINAGYNEGNPKWRALPRNPLVLAQSVTPIDTGSGLLDTACNTLQTLIFTRDHQGETIAGIVAAIKRYSASNRFDDLSFRLASGNVGVMAATNEAVDAAEVTMLLSLFGAITLLCLVTFRSLRAALCILLPLALVSLLCNALMALLDIGLKVSTLPVVALGVGVGVDYGIYLFDRIQHAVESRGANLREAYHQALRERGTAIAFTALTMTIGVGSWAFSALKFQADMGLLLAFMFFVNMLGALTLLPALAVFLVRNDRIIY